MKVVNCQCEEYDVYISRGSKWGNPFKIDVDGTRTEVIEKYRTWLMNNHQLLESLPELRGKVLGCWCKPKACHGDILVKLANRRILLP